MVPISVEDEERSARRLIQPQIQDHIATLERVFNLATRLPSEFDGKPLQGLSECLRIRLLLLGRLTDDIRCVGHLCLMGYGSQAMTLAASIFEIAHCVEYIGNDAERARRWFSITDPGKNIAKVREMVAANVAALRGSSGLQAAVDAEYAVYRRFCATKHANPTKAETNDPHLWATAGTLRVGPDLSEPGIWRTWAVLQQSVRLTLFAIAAVKRHDLGGTFPADMAATEEWCALAEQALDQRARERWGSRPDWQA